MVTAFFLFQIRLHNKFHIAGTGFSVFFECRFYNEGAGPLRLFGYQFYVENARLFGCLSRC